MSKKPTILSNYDYIKSLSVAELASYLEMFEEKVILAISNIPMTAEAREAEIENLITWLEDERQITTEYLN